MLAGIRRIKLGNVTPQRDYIFVDDVVTGLVKLAITPIASAGECTVVNLGTGSQHSVADLVNRLASIIGENIEIETDPARVRESDRPDLLADTTRLEELTGWRPQVELNDALARIWANPHVPTELVSRYEAMRKL